MSVFFGVTTTLGRRQMINAGTFDFRKTKYEQIELSIKVGNKDKMNPNLVSASEAVYMEEFAWILSQDRFTVDLPFL